MSTINVSLPAEQVSFIDALVGQYGFANRSEFIRSLVRLVKQQPTMVPQAAVFPFEAPKTTSVSAVMDDFKKTKKYSRAFLKDLNEGLNQSTYFHR